MPIYFISYHAIPLPSNIEYGISKGAYVNGWVDANNIEDARTIVYTKIEGLNWQVISLEDEKEISKEYFKYKFEIKNKN